MIIADPSVRSIRWLLWLILLTLGLAACAPAQGLRPDPTPLTVQFRWLHDPQFAGFYVADQLGYYAEEGLAVTFVEGGTDIDPVAQVVEGQAQLGIAGAEALILARAQGKPVKAVSTIFRRSPLVFITPEQSGITRPQQFAGQKVRMALGHKLTFYAMMSHVGVDPSEITEVDLPSDPAIFATGEVPIWGAYLTGLAIAVQEAGQAINIVFPDDYGVHFYADTLFTTDAFLNTHPDLVQRFVQASLRGWSYAVEHPTEVAALVQHYAPDTDPILAEKKMIASLPLINTGQDPIGWMQAADWEAMMAILMEQDILAKPIDVSSVYTLQFLDAVDTE